MTKSAYSFDESGTRSSLFENEKLANCTFSLTENSFKAFGGDKLSVKADRKYYLNNVYTNSFTNDEFKNINSDYFGVINTDNRFFFNGYSNILF